MTQNTLKQMPLNHISGKERGSTDMGRSGLAAFGCCAGSHDTGQQGPGCLVASCWLLTAAWPNDSCRQASLRKEFHIFRKHY